MPVVRRLIAHRRLIALLYLATLLLRLIVPAGYMIGDAHGRVTITLCSGIASPAAAAPAATTMTMPAVTAMPGAMAMPGMHGDMPRHGGSHDHGRAEMPCAFAGLSATPLGAVDPIQIAALIAFAMAAGFAPAARAAAARRGHLRPPLRGPPATP